MIRKETYIEMVHSLLLGVLEDDLSMGHVCSLLWSLAQPDTSEETVDLLDELREGLSDWSWENKGQLVMCEVVKINFACPLTSHGDEPCTKDQHIAMLTRIGASPGFEPERVPSQHNFSQVLVRISAAHHPEGGGLLAASPNRSFVESFREMFGHQTSKTEEEIESFRAELDALFPSAPQDKGKEE